MSRTCLLLSVLIVSVGCNSSNPAQSVEAGDVPQFMRKARAAFQEAPSDIRLSSQDLSSSQALGRNWKLSSTDAWGEEQSNIQELVFVARGRLLKAGTAEEIVMLVKVFPNAATAREWILERAFSGSAPREYLLERATKHFSDETMPGDYAFGPELFVRWNLVVEYGSDITLPISKSVDAALVELQRSKESADKAMTP